jgi:hypothetical protein
MTREIELTRGRFALVDNEDYEAVARFQWHYSNGYATRMSPRNGGPQHHVQMHRVITEAPVGVLVDHVNHDTLDNRRANLRLAPWGGNQRNQRRRRDNASGYKGVSWHTRRGKWAAYITVAKRRTHLGLFGDPILAALVYDEAARQAHGEFAHLNFMEGVQDE